MKYRVYEDYICIHWALPKHCNSGLWRLIIGFPSLKKMNGYFSHCYRVWATPPICSYLPSKWQGSFFKTNLKPSPPPQKKNETMSPAKMDHLKRKFVHLLNPYHGKFRIFVSTPQAQVSKFSKDHLLEYSCNAGSIKCNLSWGNNSRNFGNPDLFSRNQRENQEVWLEMP